MSDRELLELAAKAMGLESKWDQPRGSKIGWLRVRVGDRWPQWNPLTDDGEAFRLAVNLHMPIQPMATMGGKFIEVSAYPSGRGDCIAIEPIDECPHAATRRAIVRAAAELGREIANG